MTIAEVAKELKLTYQNTLSKVNNGTLKGQKVGNVWNIKRKDLEIYREYRERKQK